MAWNSETVSQGQVFKNNFDTGRFMFIGIEKDGVTGVFEKLPKMGERSYCVEKRRCHMSTMIEE